MIIIFCFILVLVLLTNNNFWKWALSWKKKIYIYIYMKFTAQSNFELQACRQRFIYPTINLSLFEPLALDKMQCVLFCILWQWHIKRVIPGGTHFPSSLEINDFNILLKHAVTFCPKFSTSFKVLLVKLSCKNGLFWDVFNLWFFWDNRNP